MVRKVKKLKVIICFILRTMYSGVNLSVQCKQTYQQLLNDSSFTLWVAVCVVGSINILSCNQRRFAWRPDVRRLGGFWRHWVIGGASGQSGEVSWMPKCHNGRICRQIILISTHQSIWQHLQAQIQQYSLTHSLCSILIMSCTQCTATKSVASPFACIINCTWFCNKHFQLMLFSQ